MAHLLEILNTINSENKLQLSLVSVRLFKMFKLILFYCLLATAASFPIERVEQLSYSTWHLAMNLNPSDGHLMDYTTGWADDVFIGTYANALTKDYLNREVWRASVRQIAIVRHQHGVVDAVKVFRFVESGSLLSKFQAMNPGRQVTMTHIVFVAKH